MSMSDWKTVVRISKVHQCLDCGKCTSACPIAQCNKGFSPRVQLHRALRAQRHDVLHDTNIWACLTCGLCDALCPAGIAYMDVTTATRREALRCGIEAVYPHGGAPQSLMRMMTAQHCVQNRTGWLDGGLRTAKKGEILYFVGCLPYFDVLFNYMHSETLRAARATITILNRSGIVPVILSQERCCGHDLLWGGDEDNFKRLAAHNISEIKKAGATKVVFSCPEGYRTFKLDYPKYFKRDFEVYYITEFIAQALAKDVLKFKEVDKVVTYHDACRLGRHLGMYDEPRAVLAAIPKLKLVEMSRTKQQAVCCGVSGWTNCSQCSKKIQMVRLQEAQQTGAELLVLSCPKCEIHFTCALNEEAQRSTSTIPVTQLVTLVAEALVGDGP